MESIKRKINHPIRISLSTIAILVFISACQYDEVLPQEIELSDDPVSYSLDIQPYFDMSCATSGCHDGTISPNLSPSVSYNELISNDWLNTSEPESSRLYQSITIGGSMERFSSPTETATVLKWIQEGASDN